MAEIKKVYVTKYALSDGILVRDVVIEKDMCKVPGHYGGYFHKGEFHEKIEDAKEDFERRKQQKLVSLQKSIEKISKLEFKVKK